MAALRHNPAADDGFVLVVEVLELGEPDPLHFGDDAVAAVDQSHSRVDHDIDSGAVRILRPRLRLLFKGEKTQPLPERGPDLLSIDDQNTQHDIAMGVVMVGIPAILIQNDLLDSLIGGEPGRPFVLARSGQHGLGELGLGGLEARLGHSDGLAEFREGGGVVGHLVLLHTTTFLKPSGMDCRLMGRDAFSNDNFLSSGKGRSAAGECWCRRRSEVTFLSGKSEKTRAEGSILPRDHRPRLLPWEHQGNPDAPIAAVVVDGPDPCGDGHLDGADGKRHLITKPILCFKKGVEPLGFSPPNSGARLWQLVPCCREGGREGGGRTKKVELDSLGHVFPP